ncbi:HEPN domain-containing protein [Tenacibaculum sp. 47A_GOM-205m]|uniref:HEPN domain-containing protein n=1 Tax=Tenacibaculum sp. 47A_GOM-205m TaxID=1380384 RepID=UPI00048B6268|nr:HEPN domain-containing protein [Tenacibaculum sp. 47A_GOM-205m]
MDKFLNQASHNEKFHQCICENFSDKFYDWKITTLFYIAIHYLKALAAKRGIDIGQTHHEIEQNVNPKKNNASMRIKQGAWMEYKSLLNYSRTSRYDGIVSDFETFEIIMENDYKMAVKNLDNFKKYIQKQGIEVK